LQERIFKAGDATLISFIDGYYAPKMGEPIPPGRHVVVKGDPDHGLRLMEEPIMETLRREREEGAL
jgi:hypothetical protein